MDNLLTIVCLTSPTVTVTMVALGPSGPVTPSVSEHFLSASLVTLRHNLVIVKDGGPSLVAEVLTLSVEEICWAGTVITSSVKELYKQFYSNYIENIR